MPYFDAPPASLQRMFGIADANLPEAAIVVGQWGQIPYFDLVRTIWPKARDVEEHSILIEEAGRRIWISVVFGAAMAATIAHYAARLGAQAILQIGSMGGLAGGWRVGDVLVPSLVVGRDGVSRQMCRNGRVEPSARLSSSLRDQVASLLSDATVRSGTLVSTTTISFETQRDIARWRRSGYVGVEMECAATISTAAHFGVPSAGAFVLIDNIADGHTFFTVIDEDERRVRLARTAVLRASVAAVVAAIERRSSMRDSGGDPDAM
jgi:uridine phosphorylase